MANGSAPDTRGIAFAPETFVRETGEPRTVSRAFSIAGFIPPFEIHVRDGAEDGSGRVSSARVVVDGVEVLGPSDFNEEVVGYDLDVDVAEPGSLVVELWGAPGSLLTISIDGVLQQEAEVGSEGGTTVLQGGQVTVEVPPNTVEDGTVLTAEVIDDETSPPPAGSEPIPGTRIQMGPEGTTFAEPVELSVAFDPDLVPPNVPKQNLRLFTLDADGVWIHLPGSVDLTTNKVSGLTEHFSEFAVLSLAHFCPGAGGDAFDSFQDALDATIDGGTVEVCDGTHVVQNVDATRPVTIQGAAGSHPTITADGASYGVRLDAAPGLVTVRNLRSLNDNTGLLIAGGIRIGAGYDQILVQDVDFESSTVSSALGIFRSDYPGAHAVLENVTAIGGSYAIYVLGTGGVGQVDITGATASGSSRDVWVRRLGVPTSAPDPGVTLQDVTATTAFGVWATNQAEGVGPVVNVLDSHVSGAIWYQQGASGLIQNNTFTNCHFAACIRVAGPGPQPGQSQAEATRVIANTITLSSPGSTQDGIWISGASTGPFEVRDNILAGVASGDRNDSFSYSFQGDGIRIHNPAAAGVSTGNSVSGAYRGITLSGGTAVWTAMDNTVGTAWAGVGVSDGGQLVVHSTDLTDYLVPIDTDGSVGAGDLTCNWWGDIGGPMGVDGAIAPIVYTPWALGSVAGTSTTSCTGGS